MIRIFFLIILISSFSYAHRLNVFTDYDKNQLYISAYFANGNACQNCKVKILSNEKILLESKTNIKGELEVEINNKEFTLSVDAGGGHLVNKNLSFAKKEEKSTVIKNNSQLSELEEENKKLKQKIKLLEEKLEQMDLFKTIFALFIIVLIFAFLKRIKK